MDVKIIRAAVRSRRIKWRRHALERMIEREITRDEVLTVLRKGEVIEEYAADKPFPSALVFAAVKQRPLHVVVAVDAEETTAFVITVYEPRFEIFGPDYRKRRKE